VSQGRVRRDKEERRFANAKAEHFVWFGLARSNRTATPSGRAFMGVSP
jgi:hypothetical protein